MTTDQVIDAYGARAPGLANMLGATVSAEDPDRAVIEPWADTVSGPILDVGAGTGRWSGHLASLGHDIEGLEPVEKFVEIARGAHPAVAFRLESLADLERSEERWAGILAWYSLIHLGPDELPEALATLRGVLEDRASILISFFSGPRLEVFDHPVAPAYLWPMERMDRALEQAGFEVIDRHWDPLVPHAYVTAMPAIARTTSKAHEVITRLGCFPQPGSSEAQRHPSTTAVPIVGSGPGEEQVPVPGPFDQRMVDELTPVIGVQANQ